MAGKLLRDALLWRLCFFCFFYPISNLSLNLFSSSQGHLAASLTLTLNSHQFRRRYWKWPPGSLCVRGFSYASALSPCLFTLTAHSREFSLSPSFNDACSPFSFFPFFSFPSLRNEIAGSVYAKRVSETHSSKCQQEKFGTSENQICGAVIAIRRRPCSRGSIVAFLRWKTLISTERENNGPE